jgi:gephyrin
MLLSSLQREHIHKVIDMGIAVDDKDILEEKILSTLQSADILITSGGVSMGELDLLKPILEKIGTSLARSNFIFSSIGTIHFGRILMKPGKPCTFATVNVNGADKLVFGLPGNPVSSLACFYLFCVPCFRKSFGLLNYNLTRIQTKVLLVFECYSHFSHS